MELKAVSESIKVLLETKALLAKITDLEKQLSRVENDFCLFRQKVKNAICLQNAHYENKIKILTQQVESLEMVKNI